MLCIWSIHLKCDSNHRTLCLKTSYGFFLHLGKKNIYKFWHGSTRPYIICLLSASLIYPVLFFFIVFPFLFSFIVSLFQIQKPFTSELLIFHHLVSFFFQWVPGQMSLPERLSHKIQIKWVTSGTVICHFIGFILFQMSLLINCLFTVCLSHWSTSFTTRQDFIVTSFSILRVISMVYMHHLINIQLLFGKYRKHNEHMRIDSFINGK